MSSDNIIYKQYCQAAVAGIVRWVVSCIVIGVSASRIAHEGIPEAMRISMIYNVVCGCLHFPLFGPFPTPISETKLRPRTWYIVILAASTVMWLAAVGSILYFLFLLPGRSHLLDRAALGAALGITNIALCAIQWTMIYKVTKCQRFGERYRAIGYELAVNAFQINLVPGNVSKYFAVVQQVD